MAGGWESRCSHRACSGCHFVFPPFCPSRVSYEGGNPGSHDVSGRPRAVPRCFLSHGPHAPFPLPQPLGLLSNSWTEPGREWGRISCPRVGRGWGLRRGSATVVWDLMALACPRPLSPALALLLLRLLGSAQPRNRPGNSSGARSPNPFSSSPALLPGATLSALVLAEFDTCLPMKSHAEWQRRKRF